MFQTGRTVIIKPLSEYSDAEMIDAIRELDRLIVAAGGEPQDLVLPPVGKSTKH